IRRMRYISKTDKNRTARWDRDKTDGPSGFARSNLAPRGAQATITRFYHKYQHSHEGGRGGRHTYGHTNAAAGRSRFQAGE
ncbi:MAG: hypothetical protein M3314_09500, partial [Actinomycetota bacterium]|nr:hypothetical protein [Actinomycetota bacterium]